MESTSEAARMDFARWASRAPGHAASDAVVVMDGQYLILAANDAAARMFGCSRSDLLGQSLSRLIGSDQGVVRDGPGRTDRAPVGSTELPASIHTPICGLRADGQTFPVEMSLSSIDLSIDGQPRAYFLAVLRDLSMERELHAEVAMLTGRLRTVLDLVPVPLWIVDDAHVVFANRAIAELIGIPDGDQLVGRSIESLVQVNQPKALRAAIDDALVQSSRPTFINGTVRRFDGQERHVEIVTNALPDHGRTALQMAIIDVTESYMQARDQSQHRQELRRLAASVVEAREEERRRIARELHDELGQRLTALKMEVASLGKPDPRRSTDRRINDMLGMLDNSVAALRRIAADLRPLMLDDLGLNSAIENLARDAARRMDMEVMVRLDPEDCALAPGTDIALYRMVQEALTNVGRHAHATDVRIDLRKVGDELVLTVQDNGKGFPPSAIGRNGRFGLLGLRERAIMLGGRLEIDNPPGGGGRIVVHVPLQPESSSAPEFQ